ncbi:winged helix-turn-helix domain-containing protein [Roseateles sp.]|uniref:winged helix-turn-helix domain-containing protein n=1 Tax=Roseateles sp. TaxID=1971397 RepID=UPI0039E76FC3
MPSAAKPPVPAAALRSSADQASTPPASPVSRNAASQPHFRLRMRVTVGDAIAVGPGKVALLEAVQVHRSISAAAKALGMSYRRAWLLMDELNRSLKEPAVTAAAGGPHGGGTELTDVGRQLILLYRRIEERATAACEDDIRRLTALVSS